MPQQRANGTRRVWVPAGVFGLFALVVLGRLVQLQILEHDHYAAEAREELAASSTIYATRGSILDRNGNVLASSVDTWDIYVNPRAWKDEEKAKSASEALGEALGMDPAALRTTVAEGSGDVIVARDVEYEIGNDILRKSLPGVTLRSNTARVNPEGDTAASIVGFIGQDNTGLAGIEDAYNDVLQGTPGRAVYERDTTGEPIPFAQYLTREPVPGKDVELTIDRWIQQRAEELLADAVEEHQAKGGTILVMDPSTGEILANATWPSLKYSTLGEVDLGSEEGLALLKNTTVTDLYEPGSVMKVITAAAAIDAGAVTPDTTYVDHGSVDVYGVTLNNWEYQTYGLQTMTGVLVDSINTGAVFMQQQLEAKSPGAFQRYLDAFGFGKPTGVDLMGEAAGIIRKPDDPNYSPVDLATQSFGQSISVTPLQMLSAIAAAINGGNLMRPHFVKAIISEDGTRQAIEPEVVSHPISPETSSKIRQMMDAVVNERPHKGQPEDYRAGGKSGTANVPVPNGYDQTQIASFVGFAPVDNPRVLVMVKLDENQDLETGAIAAAPVVAQMLDDTLHYLNVPPDVSDLVRKP
ncbi:MAG: peptidoglycan D,D-transpeptidase FtsI family protein [Hyphomicrobiales bacterium]